MLKNFISYVLLTTVLYLTVVPSEIFTQVYALACEEEMRTCAVHTQAPYTPYEVYVFLDTGYDGAIGMEYKLQSPVGHFVFESTPAPFITETFTGHPFGSPGISAQFTSCQTGRILVWNLTLMSPDTNPTYFYIVENEDSGRFGLLSCLQGSPFLDGTCYNWIGFNDWCSPIMSTQESSWGAIKAIYR